MGMHTGISNEADVAYNKAAARMQYSGEILQYGKSVSDAAAGGMILLSEATYRCAEWEGMGRGGHVSAVMAGGVMGGMLEGSPGGLCASYDWGLWSLAPAAAVADRVVVRW